MINKENWEEKYDEYIKRVLTEKEANRKANAKLENQDVKQFMLNIKSLFGICLNGETATFTRK